MRGRTARRGSERRGSRQDRLERRLLLNGEGPWQLLGLGWRYTAEPWKPGRQGGGVAKTLPSPSIPRLSCSCFLFTNPSPRGSPGSPLTASTRDAGGGTRKVPGREHPEGRHHGAENACATSRGEVFCPDVLSLLLLEDELVYPGCRVEKKSLALTLRRSQLR